MAGLQLCGKQSENPFYIKSLKKNIYSLEELNYFIFNHINQVYREFFDEELFTYIEKELERKDIAEKMRAMVENKASTKDLIAFLLKASRYYSLHELESISNWVSNIDSMTQAERQKMEADSLYKEKRYASALQIYTSILQNQEKDNMGRHFYGRIAYSIGTIYARLFMSKNANNYFSYAYELSPDPTYAKACVYMSVLNNDDEELLDAIIQYKIPDEQLSAIRAAVKSACNEIENSDELKYFAEHYTKTEQYKEVIENWKEMYYTMQS